MPRPIRPLNSPQVTIAPSSPGATDSEPPGIFVFRHFPQLDGLRGLAVLLVVAGHELQFGFGVTTFGALGGLGVLLFFVLSGFLITGLLDREKALGGSISLPGFYLRRAFRLFPALFFFLAVVSVLIGLRVVTDTPWYAVFACLIYVRNIWGRGSATGHIWSLSVEEQFYSTWPWIMSTVSRVNALRIAMAGAIAVTLFRMTAIHRDWYAFVDGTTYERPWFRFDAILIGCAIALWLCGSAKAAGLRDLFCKPFLAVVLWLGILAWTLRGETLTHTWFLTVQLILAALILMHLLLSADSVYLRVFSHPVARWLGKISYSWYLWQQLFLVFGARGSLALHRFPLDVAASLLLAVGSYRWIEQPFLRLKDGIGGRVRQEMVTLRIADSAYMP